MCVCVYPFLYAVLFRAEARRGAPLAGGALVLEDRVDVIHTAQPLEEGDEVQQLRVGHVVEPRGHGHLEPSRRPSATAPLTLCCRPATRRPAPPARSTHRVVGVEDVGGGGVVHDDDLAEVSTQAAQVLDVVASVEDAGLPEEAGAESAPLVQEVGDGVRVLRRLTEVQM